MSYAHVRAKWLTDLPALSWAGMLICVLMAVLALPTFQSLITTWEQHPDYSHGWLLLPVTIYLFIRARPWAAACKPMMGLGTMSMLAGGILHLASQVVPWPLLDYAGWILLIRGLTLTCWGRDAARRLLPVLAFAVLMFPLPAVWLNSLAMLLQNLIAQLADLGLNLIWVCHRSGHQLYLAGLDEPLSVAVECSGVRQLLVFLAMGWLLAFFVQGPCWRRLSLVLASIPLAILANVLRVFTLAIMARLLGPASIQGLLHDVPLLMTLPLGGLMLWWCYSRLNGHTSVTLTELSPLSPSHAARSCWLSVGVITLLILLQLSLQHHLHSSVNEQPVVDFSFNELPWQLGTWKGQPHPETDKVTQQADFADAVTLRTYTDNLGHAAAVYLVFSATGRDRLHHPEICLRDAGGAVEIKKDRRIIPLQPDTERFAERFRYQRQRQERTLIYYWHYTFMPPITGEQSFLQRVHLKQYDRWPGITVQAQTNMNDPLAWQALETTLLPELDRWLSTHIPTDAQVSASRLPVRFTHER